MASKSVAVGARCAAALAGRGCLFSCLRRGAAAGRRRVHSGFVGLSARPARAKAAFNAFVRERFYYEPAFIFRSRMKFLWPAMCRAFMFQTV